MSLATALALIAANASLTASPPPQDDPLVAIRADIARIDLSAAAKLYDTQVTARLAQAEVGKPDPLLDRMLIEYMAGYGNLRAFASVINRVVATPMAGDGDRYRLFQAKSAEDSGQFNEAEKLYGIIAADPKATAGERLDAQLGLARQQVASDPRLASVTLGAIDRSRVEKNRLWEIDLLDERAAAMTQGDAAARPILDRAWAEALDAEPTRAAPARIAGDLAFIAARADDRATYLNMLALDGFNRQPLYNQAGLASDLPVCGQDGVTPDDLAIVEAVYRSGNGNPEISLVWANRPGVGGTFLSAILHASMAGQSDAQIRHFALRCRTVPSTDYTLRGTMDDEVSAWITGEGAYPQVEHDQPDLFNLVSELNRREASFGKDSILVLPQLMQIEPLVIGMANPQSKESGQRARDIAQRLHDILVQNKAPSSLIMGTRIMLLMASVVAQSIPNDQAAGQAGQIMLDAAKDPSTPLEQVYILAMSNASTPFMPSEVREGLLKEAADLFRERAGLRDPRTVALVFSLAKLKSDNGDKAAAAALRTSLKLDTDLCATADPTPRFSSSNIVSDDYPSDILYANVTGNTVLELDLDATGHAVRPRIILADPPYAFDMIARERASTIRYDLAGGNACRGIVQNILWRMPDQGYD